MEPPIPSPPPGGWAVEAQALDCARDGRSVLQGLDLHIADGQLVGVFGSNGAGKTTLLQTLAGILPAAGGSLRLLGGSQREARTGIGYVGQIVPDGAFSPLHAAAFVGAAWRGERFGLGLGHAAARRRAVEQALRDAGAEHLARRPMDALSGGERQRVCIAQALVNPVRLLLLDEPLANLDPGAQAALLRLIDRLCHDNGLSVLLSAHDINPLLTVMDGVVYLAGGHGRMGSVAQIVNSEALSALYGVPMCVTRHEGYLFIHPVRGFMAESAAHCGHDHGAHASS